jgi:hypothetical protein
MNRSVHRISLAKAWRPAPLDAVDPSRCHPPSDVSQPEASSPDEPPIPQKPPTKSGLDPASDASVLVPHQRLAMVRAFHQPSGLIDSSIVRLRWVSRTPDQVRLVAFWLNDLALPLRHCAAEYDWEIGAELQPSNRLRLVIECEQPLAIEPNAASLNLPADLWPFDLWLEISDT